VQWFALVQFALLLAGVAAFLWQADAAPLADNAVWFGVLLVSQWALGAVMQGRFGMPMALMLQSAALATATSALGFTAWHWVFKPLTMVIALVLVASSAYPQRTRGRFGTKTTLLILAALAGSLAGDAFLMVPGFFIPGLVSFLVAHLFYVALFKSGQRWFPHRGALAGTLAFGVGMYTFLWTGGLPPALRVSVAAYVLVIALMAAQAIGRATVLRDAPSLLVAVGAAFFMLSDSLLATNRFVMPLPMAQVWVLSTYYAAQALIVGGWLAHEAGAPAIAAQATNTGGDGRSPTARDMAVSGAPETAVRSS
jgi:alkylglycerol monooxygenase